MVAYALNRKGPCLGNEADRVSEIDAEASIAPGDLCFLAVGADAESPWGNLVAKHSADGFVGVSKIMALHKVRDGLTLTEAKDRKALELIRPFMGSEAHPPINPAWRPVLQREAALPEAGDGAVSSLADAVTKEAQHVEQRQRQRSEHANDSGCSLSASEFEGGHNFQTLAVPV
jgi:hypothetical protein